MFFSAQNYSNLFQYINSNSLFIITISSIRVNPCCLFISAPYVKWRYSVSAKGQKRGAKKGTGKRVQRINAVLQERTADLRAGLKFPSPGGEGRNHYLKRIERSSARTCLVSAPTEM